MKKGAARDFQKFQKEFQKVMLIILDGFGEGKKYKGNAIALAKTPTLDYLKKNYPHTLLKASGRAVGIPEGTQGGSEVGHFTMGSGRITWQSLEEMNRAIKNKSFFKKKPLLDICNHVRGKNSSLHLIGMISDQGVHSDIRHLFALLELAKKEKIKKINIHAITDGRDVPEKSAIQYVKQLEKIIKKLKLESTASIATIIGRYYAMDRDGNWNRTQKAYDLYTKNKGKKEENATLAIENAYKSGTKSDYYIEPLVLDKKSSIQNEDGVIFWNFRTDRTRQITWAFTRERKNPIKKIVSPFIVCLGDYSEKAPVVFPSPLIKNNLGSMMAKNNLPQLRIAETEKYAHVTYFFNSQIEKPFPQEERKLIDSAKCPSYAEKPEMSAREITGALLEKMKKNEYALIVLNFANCDLVGHSGNLSASIKAVEVIDECLGKIIPKALEKNYHVIVTGDHGNIEYMIYDTGGKRDEPCPSHTTNPVPFLFISEKYKKAVLQKGELQDIAPTILKIMNIKKPKEMTGKILIKKSSGMTKNFSKELLKNDEIRGNKELPNTHAAKRSVLFYKESTTRRKRRS